MDLFFYCCFYCYPQSVQLVTFIPHAISSVSLTHTFSSSRIWFELDLLLVIERRTDIWLLRWPHIHIELYMYTIYLSIYASHRSLPSYLSYMVHIACMQPFPVFPGCALSTSYICTTTTDTTEYMRTYACTYAPTWRPIATVPTSRCVTCKYVLRTGATERPTRINSSIYVFLRTHRLTSVITHVCA